MAESLYIHIPFCRKKCPYCDFCSLPYQKELAADYIKALCCQVEKLERSFSTIYTGGGTPTVLDKALLDKLLKKLQKLSAKNCEWTIEANPESLDEEKARLCLERGVNRISIGLQSLRDDKLKKLGRIHSCRQAISAVRLAEKAGFKNISIDLIFGVEGESVKEWKQELKQAVSLPVKHISVYSLTYEKGTPLYKQLKKKKITPLDDSITAKMHELSVDCLRKQGLERYEVSNFAKPGFSCRHNFNYWENNSYIGLGACAASYEKGVRKRYTEDVKSYISLPLKSAVVFQEKLSPLKRAKETAALKIRTKEGIDFNWFKKQSGFDLLKVEAEGLKQALRDRLVRYRKKGSISTGVCLTEKGFLFCDTVCSGFL